MSAFERIWPLDGVENFRDYGGYAVAGGTVRTGRLYRSAHHNLATDFDLDRIDSIDLGAVVDLRRPTERERQPSRRGPGFRAEVILNDTTDRPDDPFLVHLQQSDLSAAAMQQFMVEYYDEAPFEPRLIDLYSRYFDALATTDAPVLIHCSAGKDRTGLLAALTHRLLGVSEDDIVADYLLTNNPERFERRAPLFAAFVFDLTGRTPTIEAIHATMGVEARYLETAFAAIDRRAGDLGGYMREVLGVDDAKAEIIRSRLIV